MLASEIRANARKSLDGKWGKAVLLVLCYLLIVYGISFVLALIPFVGPIISAVISVPISYGILVSFIKLKRGEKVKYAGFFDEAFSNFGKVWSVYGHVLLKMLLPIILAIIFIILFVVSSSGALIFSIASNSNASGLSAFSIIAFIGYIISLIYCTVKGYLYSLTNYILYDNPNMSGKEIVEESERLMRGNRWKFVWLGLTFIGWMILSIFTFYIGLLWLYPYIIVSSVCFYETLAKKGSKEETIEVENNSSIEE